MDIFSTSYSDNNSTSQCGSKRYCSYLLLFYLTSVLLERQQKCWGWGECHPAVVNRNDFDCSICPTADPSTWTPEDIHFEVACDDDVGTLSFRLDNLLEANWFASLLSPQLVSTSNDGEEIRVPLTGLPGVRKKLWSGILNCV